MSTTKATALTKKDSIMSPETAAQRLSNVLWDRFIIKKHLSILSEDQIIELLKIWKEKLLVYTQKH